MRDRLFIVVFALVIGSVVAGYVYSYRTGESFSRIEFGLGEVTPRGSLPAVERAIESKRLKRVVRGEYQAKIQNYMRREFLFFDSVLLGYSDVQSRINRSFYSSLLPGMPLVPVGVDTSNMFVDTRADSLVQVSMGDSQLIETAAQNAADAQTLTEWLPDVTFVYYGVSVWTMTDRARDAGFADPSDEAWDVFKRDISSFASVSDLDVNDWGELFFHTDHHWKPRGSYRGYLDIVEMLSESDPAVAERTLPFAERVIDVDYLGTSARRAAYAFTPEKFRVFDSHGQKVRATEDGKNADWLIANERYLEDPPTAPFTNHYGLYSGPGRAAWTFTNGAKPPTGNILVFGDSFSHVIDDSIAEHYDTTYFIDLRHFSDKYGQPFDIEVFVRENNIKTVLFVGRPVRVMSMPTALVEGTSIQ